MIADQKGQALIIVLFMTTVIFLVGGAAVTMGTAVRKNSAYEASQKKAYYIAEAGAEKALARARSDNGWVEGLATGSEYGLVPGYIDSDYAGGEIIYVKVKKEGADLYKNTLSVESQGLYNRVYRKVKVLVEVRKPLGFYRGVWTESPDSAPSQFNNNSNINADLLVNGNVTFMNNCRITESVWVDGNVTVSNNVSITPFNLYSGGNVTIENNGLVSGNVEACGDVFLGNNAGVGGNIKAMGNVTLNSGASAGGSIWANGAINLDEHAEVGGGTYPNQSLNLNFTIPDFPTIDVEMYRKDATSYFSGDQTWTGALDLDGLYFIDGDLDIHGTYSGVATIVVNGEVNINGDLVPSDIEENDLCILSTGNISAVNNVMVKALLYSPGVITLDNNEEMQGSVIGRTVNLTNNASITYRQDLAERQPDWVTSKVNIISWE